MVGILVDNQCSKTPSLIMVVFFLLHNRLCISFIQFCSRLLEVGRILDELLLVLLQALGWNLDELLLVSLQVLANQPSENEGGSSCEYTLTFKSVRAQNIVYIMNIMNIMQRCELRYSLWVVVYL